MACIHITNTLIIQDICIIIYTKKFWISFYWLHTHITLNFIIISFLQKMQGKCIVITFYAKTVMRSDKNDLADWVKLSNSRLKKFAHYAILNMIAINSTVGRSFLWLRLKVASIFH